jgi:hypothetical protein
MLKVINLYVIDKIFDEAENPISHRAKMVYINCLMSHFRNKKANVANAVAFDMFEEDFVEFNKYKPYLQELHKAGLIEIGINKVAFHNHWGKHIDKTQLEKVNPDEFVGNFNFLGIENFEKDLKENNQIIELSQMKYKIRKEDVQKLMELFIMEQKTFNKKYTGLSDCIKHFTYWLPSQIKQMPKEANKQVKSQGKILGYE